MWEMLNNPGAGGLVGILAVILMCVFLLIYKGIQIYRGK